MNSYTGTIDDLKTAINDKFTEKITVSRDGDKINITKLNNIDITTPLPSIDLAPFEKYFARETTKQIIELVFEYVVSELLVLIFSGTSQADPVAAATTAIGKINDNLNGFKAMLTSE